MIKENDYHWFPMRIRHASLQRLQSLLDNLNKEKERLEKENILLDAYAPMRFIKVNMSKMDFAPYLLNYIFVRSTFTDIVSLKSNKQLFEPLRFVMHPAYDEKYNPNKEVVVIPDKRMEDYRRVTQSERDDIIFLRDPQYAAKPSQAVQIIEGDFAGVIGKIKRVRGKRCVVLTISDMQAAAIVDVHQNHLRFLTEVEIHDYGLEAVHI